MCLYKMSLVSAPESINYNPEDKTCVLNTNEGHRYGQTLEAACAQDPMAHLHKIIVTIQSSG